MPQQGRTGREGRRSNPDLAAEAHQRAARRALRSSRPTHVLQPQLVAIPSAAQTAAIFSGESAVIRSIK